MVEAGGPATPAAERRRWADRSDDHDDEPWGCGKLQWSAYWWTFRSSSAGNPVKTPRIVTVELTRESTDERGIFEAIWKQREHWKVTFVREGNGLTLANVEGVREEKSIRLVAAVAVIKNPWIGRG